MPSSKAKTAKTQSNPAVEKPRPTSYTRFKSPLRGGGGNPHGPSTSPPPPFESEAEIPALEWWLTAHMGLASELLWLEQLLEGASEGGAHLETMQRLVSHVEGVRDALYELYCDAADERLMPLVAGRAPLESFVRLSYTWSKSVVGVLAAITYDLRARGEAGLDWPAAKAGFRESEALVPKPSPAMRDAVRALPIDFTSPFEPLRNLPQDLEQLFASIEALHSTLAKRFG
jgi:hypothetical protein